MIFYFTGTGNSLWAAKEIGKELNQPVENIIKQKTESNFFCKDDIIGFVFPTYMRDLPWIVKEFLLKLTVNPDCYTFVVMTSNNGKSGNSFVSQVRHFPAAVQTCRLSLICRCQATV